MDSGVVASPALVARPLRLEPLNALMLSADRIGARVSGRAFARPYHGVAARFAAWQRTGRVTRDPEPALYLHEYTASGITIRGLVGALDLTSTTDDSAAAAVLPHEGVHPAQVAELADRMAEMALNPAPILLTHAAPAPLRGELTRVRSEAADHQFTDRSGQYHRIWAIRAPQTLARVQEALGSARAVIADGHHRYAAYQQLRRTHPELAPASGAGLAMLVDQVDTPLFLGAIHRVLAGIDLGDLDRVPGLVRSALGPQEAVGALAPDTLVATDGRSWTTIGLSRPGSRLAVELLHEDLLPALPRPPHEVGYAHSVDDALRAVARRRGVAVLMPAPEFADVLQVVTKGRLLPEKATSFQPKPSLGVLIRSLNDG